MGTPVDLILGGLILGDLIFVGGAAAAFAPQITDASDAIQAEWADNLK